jgi:hypothetical protein
MVGEQTVDMTYLFEGMRDASGTTLAVLKLTRTLRFAGENANQRKILEQSSEGEILFDAALGRLHSATQTFKATIETTVGGARGTQLLEQKSEVSPQPAD